MTDQAAAAAGSPAGLIYPCASFSRLNGNCFAADLLKQSENRRLVWVTLHPLAQAVTEKAGTG